MIKTDVIEFKRGGLASAACPRCGTVGSMRFRGGWRFMDFDHGKDRIYYINALCCDSILHGRITNWAHRPPVDDSVWPNNGDRFMEYEHISQVRCPRCSSKGDVTRFNFSKRPDGSNYIRCNGCSANLRGICVNHFGERYFEQKKRIAKAIEITAKAKAERPAPKMVLIMRRLDRDEESLIRQWLSDSKGEGALAICDIYDDAAATRLFRAGVAEVYKIGDRRAQVRVPDCKKLLDHHIQVAGRM